MCRHSLLFKHSKAAALIFARKVLLQQYCAESVTVHSAIRREWGWAVLWGYIYKSFFCMVQAKNLLSHLIHRRTLLAASACSNEVLEMDWDGFKLFPMWKAVQVREDHSMWSLPSMMIKSDVPFTLYFKFSILKSQELTANVQYAKILTKDAGFWPANI